MTTEVFWGNDHLNQPTAVVKVEPKTVGEQETEAILKIAQVLHQKEQQVEELKQRFTQLELQNTQLREEIRDLKDLTESK